MTPTVKAVATRTHCYALADSQTFANTSDAWEIWRTSPRQALIKSIPRSSVLWVLENESVNEFFRHCMLPAKTTTVASRSTRSK